MRVRLNIVTRWQEEVVSSELRLAHFASDLAIILAVSLLVVPVTS